MSHGPNGLRSISGVPLEWAFPIAQVENPSPCVEERTHARENSSALLFARSAGLAASCAPAETDPAAQRRTQVESGLLRAVSFKGEENTYSVAERMACHGRLRASGILVPQCLPGRTGQGQHSFLGVGQVLNALVPQAATVLHPGAQDLLEKGRRNLVVLLVGPVRVEGQRTGTELPEELRSVFIPTLLPECPGAPAPDGSSDEGTETSTRGHPSSMTSNSASASRMASTAWVVGMPSLP